MKSSINAGLIFASSIVVCLAGFLFAGPCEYRLCYSQSSISIHPNQVKHQLTTAAQAGYNGYVSCDWALETLEKQPASVFTNYQQVQSLAKQLGIELIPWHFYQGQPATENLNLAEAFPVRGTPFLVANGKAGAVSPSDLKIKNGGFETGSTVPSGWKFSGTLPAMDTQYKHGGKASLRYTNPMGDTYLKCMVSGLTPFRAYELSVWIRTQGYSDTYHPRFSVQNGAYCLLHSRDMGFAPNGISPNASNFTRYRADFNSTTATSAVIRFLPTAGGATGSIWIDDITIREVGLYEAIRRPSCPITVKSKDGTKIYVEGKDYTVDARCDNFTLANLFYEASLTVPAGSGIKNGEELTVDWNQYADVETRVPSSDFCLPETWTTLQDNLNRIDKLYGNSDYMFSMVDEWRVGAWNENCASFKFSHGGEYIAQSWYKMECMLRKTGNGCRTVFVWNDMFDPYHNSDLEHPLVRGGTLGAWTGLSDDVIIVNWNTAKITETLSFFKGIDPKYPGAVSCRQIVNVPDVIGTIPQWIKGMKELESKGGAPVVGMNWVNWFGDYTGIKPTADACKAAGWWGTNALPKKTCAPITACATVQSSVEKKPVRVSASASTGLTIRKGGRGKSHITFQAPSAAQTSLAVFDMQGRLVRTLAANTNIQGKHTATWNTSSLPVGVYLLSLTVNGGETISMKHLVY